MGERRPFAPSPTPSAPGDDAARDSRSAAEASDRGARRKRLAWFAGALAVSAALLLYLVRRFDLQRLAAMVRAARPTHLALAFLLYVLLNAARAVRFRLLLEQQALTLAVLMPVVLVHNLLVRIVPFSLGEVSYVALLKHRGVDVSEGVGTLVGARLLDLLLVLVGGLVALALSPAALDGRGLSLAVCLVPVTCGAILFAGPLLRIAAALVGRARGSWGETLAGKARRTAARLDALRRPRLLGAVLVASLGTYATSVAFNGVLLHTAGARAVDLPSTLAAISAAMLLASVPLSIAGLGVVEGSWTVSLVLLGRLETSRAVAVGFFLHGCQLLCAVLSGGGGFLWLVFQQRRPRREREVS